MKRRVCPARTSSGEVYRGVDVPDVLVPNEWELKHFKQGVDAALAVTVPLLEIFEDDPCGTYGEGRCVVHTYPGDVCPYGEVQDFLRRAAGEEQVWRATVADPYLYWCLDHRPFIAVAPVLLRDVHPSVPIACVQCGRAIRRVPPLPRTEA